MRNRENKIVYSLKNRKRDRGTLYYYKCQIFGLCPIILSINAGDGKIFELKNS